MKKADFPPPGDPFYSQFDDPAAAYSNLPGLFLYYLVNEIATIPADSPDYVQWAHEQTENTRTARLLGATSWAIGNPPLPFMDLNLLQLLDRRGVTTRNPTTQLILDSWAAGWHGANAATPIRNN